MGNGDGIVPPQGLNVIEKQDTLYGLPLAIPTGGGGTKVTVKQPTGLKFGSGMVVKLIDGTYTPAVLPPVSTDPKSAKIGSGAIVRIVTPLGIQSGGGTIIRIVTPIKIQNGGGVKAAKV